MNKKALFLLTNAPIWVIILSFTYSISFYRYINPPEGFKSGGMLPTVSYAFTIILWLFSSFYLFYSFIVPKHLVKDKNPLFWIYTTIYIFLVGPLFISILDEFRKSIFNKEYPFKNTIELFWMYPSMIAPSWLILCGITLLCGFLGILCRLAFDSFNNLQQKKELENKNLLSEIRVIKSKLNPHLLFNTLNNIDTLIQTNPAQASKSLSKLSDILRYVVYDTENEMISIQKEIDSIKKYIDLERIRLVNPDAVSFSSEILVEVNIPPMIFFPFVENGFKHSNLNDPSHILQIQISAKNSKIFFSCINTIYEKQQKSESCGIGLELANKRLELLYPGRYKLDISQNNNEFSVSLQIDLDK